MKLNLLKWAVASLALSAVAPAAASAQKITDEHVQELIQAAAVRIGVPAQTQTGTATPQPPAAAGADRATMSLTLDDAIKLALDRNLDIAVQRLNPQTFDYSIA